MTRFTGVRSSLVAVWLAALVLPVLVADPAAADPLPRPSPDYEDEALEQCADGDIECVGDVLDTMRQHTRQLVRACDHDAIFATLYTVVTDFYYETVRENPDFFVDTAFVNHEDAVFAYYYFWPYVNWHEGLRGTVPPAWGVAFRAADNQEVNAAGNLLLGINAHVSRDLPFVLYRLGLGDRTDHRRVNDILREAYGPAMTAINDHLADSIDETNVRGTTLDDEVLFRLVVSMRDQAWRDAGLLALAGTERRRAAVAATIERRAHVQALEYRAQFAYGPRNRQRAERNAYCEENAWPPDWLQGF